MDNMTRVTLELGGKLPTIVMADANLQEEAAGAATANFFNQGQVCCAGSRLYVQRKHFDNVIADIAGIANGMKLGNGLDPSVQMGQRRVSHILPQKNWSPHGTNSNGKPTRAARYSA